MLLQSEVRPLAAAAWEEIRGCVLRTAPALVAIDGVRRERPA